VFRSLLKAYLPSVDARAAEPESRGRRVSSPGGRHGR